MEYASEHKHAQTSRPAHLPAVGSSSALSRKLNHAWLLRAALPAHAHMPRSHRSQRTVARLRRPASRKQRAARGALRTAPRASSGCCWAGPGGSPAGPALNRCAAGWRRAGPACQEQQCLPRYLCCRGTFARLPACVAACLAYKHVMMRAARSRRPASPPADYLHYPDSVCGRHAGLAVEWDEPVGARRGAGRGRVSGALPCCLGLPWRYACMDADMRALSQPAVVAAPLAALGGRNAAGLRRTPHACLCCGKTAGARLPCRPHSACRHPSRLLCPCAG